MFENFLGTVGAKYNMPHHVPCEAWPLSVTRCPLPTAQCSYPKSTCVCSKTQVPDLVIGCCQVAKPKNLVSQDKRRIGPHGVSMT
ncbi:hypothetical protein VTO42DRAFT_5408 [Malbranchea cinnamomea]